MMSSEIGVSSSRKLCELDFDNSREKQKRSFKLLQN